MLVAVAAGLLVVAAGCGPYPQSSLHPVSDMSGMIDDLFRTIFWWAVVVFVVVEGLLVYVLLRFRRHRADEEVAHIHGSALLEFGWTLAPAVILVLIAIPTMRTIFAVDQPPEEESYPIEVVGHQWWWEFRYPEEGAVTANEVHVPAGRPVELRITSADVIHSFWVPRVAGKRDALPGDTTHLWFTVDSAAVHPGQCAEFCGTSHALMQMRLVVQPPEEFRDWVRAQSRPDTLTAEADSLALEGRRTFMGLCSACHAVRGTRARGRIGPDLTNFMRRHTLAAGVLENTAENRRRWLDDPQAIKPANKMQIPDLSDAQIRALNAYLETLK